MLLSCNINGIFYSHVYFYLRVELYHWIFFFFHLCYIVSIIISSLVYNFYCYTELIIFTWINYEIETIKVCKLDNIIHGFSRFLDRLYHKILSQTIGNSKKTYISLHEYKVWQVIQVQFQFDSLHFTWEFHPQYHQNFIRPSSPRSLNISQSRNIKKIIIIITR